MNKLKLLVLDIQNFTITGKEKAVVAFIVASVGSYLTQHGLTTKDLLDLAILKDVALGVVAHALVYFTTNTER